ncbi:MAG: hypothetical protein CMG69_02360 [Candidatus Marinimicrobia bacterium]|nr:hypothetical protein [Candidatus Neomarinimicrobiota bacterium]|tara:strand:+ start:63436 stop:64401 length:966 start_codon:yes stop_codon:yes gene_type:complete
MAKTLKWSESALDFKEIARIHNSVLHDFLDHPGELKKNWKLRDKTGAAEKYFLFNKEERVGVIHMNQGTGKNHQNCYFEIFIIPEFQSYENYKILYDQMLRRVKEIQCNLLYPWSYLHENYKNYIDFLKREDFEIVMRHREYKLNVENFDFSFFEPLLDKLRKNGIQLYDSKNKMQNFSNHYKKLEELVWNYIQDEPMPDGDFHVRKSYERWLEKRKEFEENSYGVEMVAVKKDEYIGSTRVKVNKMSEPNRGYTESTGVLKQFRRQGIATALKVESIKKLSSKDIKEIRTGNEINNPMYKINEKLGFEMMEQSIEFRKVI